MASKNKTPFFLSLVTIFCAFAHTSTSQCGDICWSDVCEFHLTLTFGTTADSHDNNGHTTPPAHIPQTPISGGSCPGTPDEEITVTGDGRRRSVLLVNGQFPGPTLQVKLGTQVIVYVHNQLQTVSTSIHWHGISMFGSQWMDGVAYITQCPIPPGHMFTHNFTAQPAGSHWYHPHMSNHRRDGLYGLFVVHESKPSFTEFPLVLSDLNERIGVSEVMTDLRRGVYGKYTDPVSSLINGRGRHSSASEAPLTSFHVEASKTYKFRTLNAAADLGFELSIDGHQLRVTSWDGSDIEPITVSGFNIFPGERIDFTVDTTDKEGGFWIRAKSLANHGSTHIHNMSEAHHDPSQNGEDLMMHMDNDNHTSGSMAHNSMKMSMSPPESLTEKPNSTPSSEHGNVNAISNSIPGSNPQNAFAVFSYGPSSHQGNHPQSTPNQCTPQNQCAIFNCYKHYSEGENKNCVQLKDIHSLTDTSYYTDPESVVAEEYFLNVGIIAGATIRSREFISPLSPLYQPYNHSIVDCDMACTDANKGCSCTHSLSLPFGKYIQIIFSNIEMMSGMPPGNPNHHGSHAIGHPMHIHGHRFAVIEHSLGGHPAMGAGGKPTNNPDIHCDTALCKNPQWSAVKKKISYHRKKPPLKDTIIVPPGGYAVLRLRTDNPGYWLVHCHVMRDQLDGMAMLLGVAPEQVAPAPSHHPVCHTEAYQCANNQCNAGPFGVMSQNVSGTVLVSLLCLGSGLLVGAFIVVLCYRCKRKKSYINHFPRQIRMYSGTTTFQNQMSALQ